MAHQPHRHHDIRPVLSPHCRQTAPDTRLQAAIERQHSRQPFATAICAQRHRAGSAQMTANAQKPAKTNPASNPICSPEMASRCARLLARSASNACCETGRARPRSSRQPQSLQCRQAAHSECVWPRPPSEPTMTRFEPSPSALPAGAPRSRTGTQACIADRAQALQTRHDGENRKPPGSTGPSGWRQMPGGHHRKPGAGSSAA